MRRNVLFRAVRLIGIVAILLAIAFGVVIIVSPAHDLQCNGLQKAERAAAGKNYHCYIGP